MIIKPTAAFLIWKSNQIEIPTYKNGIGIIFRQINQFTEKNGLEFILGCPIHGDEGPCEVVSFVSDIEFNMKLSISTSQNIHSPCINAK